MKFVPISEKEFLEPIKGETIDVTITAPLDGKPRGKVLFVHGAGQSTKERVLPLARALAARGWHCLAFSLPGHGKSSGALLGSTLAGRTAITRAIAERYGFLPSDIAVGVSMGAHTLVSLLAETHDLFKHIVLLVPAAYAAEAEDVPFGPDFSDILRRPGSYRSAKVWDVLPRFTGQLTTIATDGDTVIPPEIYELFHKHSKGAARQHVLIKGSPHQISFWLAEDPARVEAFADAIDSADFTPLVVYGEHRLVP